MPACKALLCGLGSRASRADTPKQSLGARKIKNLVCIPRKYNMTTRSQRKIRSSGITHYLVFLILTTFSALNAAHADSAIFGKVFKDNNRNGFHDTGEPVLKNHNLYLEDLTLISKGQGGDFSAVTGDDGKYFFAVHSVGKYNISTDLETNEGEFLQLLAPTFAEGFMPPYPLSITQDGQIIQLDFALAPEMSEEDAANGTAISSELNIPSDISFENLLANQVLHISCNGDANDQSEKQLTVENHGVTFVLDKLGHRGRTCFFDSTDYLRIPKNSVFDLSQFTLSAWIKVHDSDTGTTTRTILSNDDGSAAAQSYGLKVSKGTAVTFYDDGNQLNGAKDVENTIALNDGQWHHIAAVFEGGVNTKLYVDGQLKRKSSGVAPMIIKPSGDLYIGQDGTNGYMDTRWLGSMDDIRIIGKAFSTNEVNRLLSVIDLPTGEIFTPLGVRETDPFVVSFEDQKTAPIMVVPHADGRVSLSTVPGADNNTRSKQIAPPAGTTLVLDDGNATLLDEANPGVVANLNIFGDMEVTSEGIPNLRLVLRKGSDRFAFQSNLYPSLFTKVNHDGSLDIIDETQPNMSILRHKDGTYTLVDRDTNTITLIKTNGDAVLRHVDYPEIVAKFNIFDDDSGYVLADIEDNYCLQMNADGSVAGRLRGNFFTDAFDKAKEGVLDGIKEGVKKVTATFVEKGVEKLVSLVALPAAKTLGTLAAGAAAKFAGWFACLPALGQFAVVGGLVLGAAVIIGGVVAAILSFKKMEKEIKQLRAQVQQLTAVIEEQARRITHLEKVVEDQAKTIARLEEEVAARKAEMERQAKEIEDQARRIAELEDQAAKDREIREANEQRMKELEARLEQLEKDPKTAKEGVDAVPEGDEVDPNTRSRVRTTECHVVVSSIRDILDFERVEPAFCQLYGVQDKAANDSIFFIYNPQDNTTLQIGETCEGCDIESMAIHPVTNEIYLGSGDNAKGHSNGHLYKLDAATGELRAIGATGFTDISGLTFDSENQLWAWAKDAGLVKLNTLTAQGELVLPSSAELADLTWNAANQAFYGTIGKELWSYTPADGSVNKLCSNLPPKTEALRVLPSSVLSDDLVLLGAHRNSRMKLQAFDVANCQRVLNQDVIVGYDDVEGLDMPVAACQ